MKRQRVIVPLYGLNCRGGGILLIERVLARTPGVLSVYANAATEMAYVLYDPEQVNLDGLVKAVERAGFRAGIPNVR